MWYEIALLDVYISRGPYLHPSSVAFVCRVSVEGCGEPRSPIPIPDRLWEAQMSKHCLPAGPRLQLEALEMELDELYAELMAITAEITALVAALDAEL